MFIFQTAKIASYFICFLLFLAPKKTNSQTNFNTIDLNNNGFKITDSIYKNWCKENKKAVFFFCPILNFKKEDYYKKAQILMAKKRMKSVNNATIHFVFYKEDSKRNSKNPILYNRNRNDSVFIGQFECYIFNEDEKLIDRAIKNNGAKYYKEKIFQNEKLYKITTTDSVACFSDLPDRIPYYSELIGEVFNPIYTNEEKFIMIQDTINGLRKELNIIKQEQAIKNDYFMKEINEIKGGKIKKNK
jgi:hypothetical protein